MCQRHLSKTNSHLHQIQATKTISPRRQKSRIQQPKRTPTRHSAAKDLSLLPKTGSQKLVETWRHKGTSTITTMCTPKRTELDRHTNPLSHHRAKQKSKQRNRKPNKTHKNSQKGHQKQHGRSDAFLCATVQILCSAKNKMAKLGTGTFGPTSQVHSRTSCLHRNDQSALMLDSGRLLVRSHSQVLEE